MDVEFGGPGLVDLYEELLELLGPMATPRCGDHFTGGHVERREEIRDAVALVVVRATLHLSGAHRKN